MERSQGVSSVSDGPGNLLEIQGKQYGGEFNSQGLRCDTRRVVLNAKLQSIRVMIDAIASDHHWLSHAVTSEHVMQRPSTLFALNCMTRPQINLSFEIM